MIQITINKKTPSINHLYGYNKFGHFYLKKEGRELRKYIEEKIKDLISKEVIQDFSNVKLSVIVEIYENWLTKKRMIKKKDIANREKFLIDSVFNSLGLDDCFVFKHTMIKVQSDEEKFVISIEKDRDQNKIL